MLHYHCTPITPRAQLLALAGRNFCVSFSDPRDADTCMSIGQSVMFDCGAYSAWKRGTKLKVDEYYQWLAPRLTPPHFAVVPDVIDGTLEEQWEARSTWPRYAFGYANCAPVWHLHLPIEELMFLVEAYPKVCIGSSGQYAQIGTRTWVHRMDEVFNELAKNGRMPWIHGLRMQGQLDGGWPFASADSGTVAMRNRPKGFGKRTNPKAIDAMAGAIDAQQPVSKWKHRQQLNLLEDDTWTTRDANPTPC